MALKLTVEVQLQRLINKVNVVTSAFRHHGLNKVTEGHLNELVERQNEIERWFDEYLEAREVSSAVGEGEKK